MEGNGSGNNLIQNTPEQLLQRGGVLEMLQTVQTCARDFTEISVQISYTGDLENIFATNKPEDDVPWLMGAAGFKYGDYLPALNNHEYRIQLLYHLFYLYAEELQQHLEQATRTALRYQREAMDSDPTVRRLFVERNGAEQVLTVEQVGEVIRAVSDWPEETEEFSEGEILAEDNGMHFPLHTREKHDRVVADCPAIFLESVLPYVKFMHQHDITAAQVREERPQFFRLLDVTYIISRAIDRNLHLLQHREVVQQLQESPGFNELPHGAQMILLSRYQTGQWDYIRDWCMRRIKDYDNNERQASEYKRLSLVYWGFLHPVPVKQPRFTLRDHPPEWDER